MFASKVGTYLLCALLKGRLFALPTNFRLGLKGLREKYTLAYYEHFYITDVKSFITLRPGVKISKLSFLPLMLRAN